MLGKYGGEVTMAKCDTSFIEDSRACIETAAVRRQGGHGIAGVLMAGGVLRDAVLRSQTPGQCYPFAPDR